MSFEPRDKILILRIESDLHDSATKAATSYGLSALVRALLKAYLRGDVQLQPKDLTREMVGPQRGPRGKRKKCSDAGSHDPAEKCPVSWLHKKPWLSGARKGECLDFSLAMNFVIPCNGIVHAYNIVN